MQKLFHHGDVKYSRFIRTTESQHRRAVSSLWVSAFPRCCITRSSIVLNVKLMNVLWGLMVSVWSVLLYSALTYQCFKNGSTFSRTVYTADNSIVFSATGMLRFYVFIKRRQKFTKEDIYIKVPMKDGTACQMKRSLRRTRLLRLRMQVARRLRYANSNIWLNMPCVKDSQSLMFPGGPCIPQCACDPACFAGNEAGFSAW